MRIVHFADLHLGVENYGRLDPQTGLSSRVVDFLKALDKLVDYSIEQNVDLVLFAGDAFKNRTPPPTYQREFARRIHKLAVDAGIPTFLLVGNHDVPASQKRASTLDIFSTLSIPRVTVGRKPGIYHLKTKSGVVQILALPWITRAMFLGDEKFHATSLEEAENEILRRVHIGISDFIGKLDSDLPTVFAFHGSVQGAAFGSERSIMIGNDILLPPSLFRSNKVDYVALGHIHKHQEVMGDPPAVYAGSMERIDFGEAREAKGFVVVDLEKGKTKWEFVDVHARPFVDIRVDVRGESEPTLPVVREINKHDINGAVVRLRILMEEAQEASLNEKVVVKSLERAFSVAGVVKNVERASRLRLGSRNVEGMTPAELLEVYFKSKSVPADRISKLMERANLVFRKHRGIDSAL